MTPTRVLALATASALLLAAVAPAPAETWVADNGDGTYKNPVLYADYSDPDVAGVDGDYYMTASSFNCVPGLPILHSRDLVNWRLVNHALPRLYAPMFDRPQHGNGVWAPSIRYHDGYWRIYWGDPDLGIYTVRAKDPQGEWSEPVLVKKAHGNIDPCPLWDDDGRVYLVHAFAHSRAGVNSLLTVVELTPDGEKAIDKGWIVYDGHELDTTIEGPKFYKRNGYYYIFAPAGGVSTGWQVVLRSKQVRGPYERRVVLAQGDTDINGPHQGGWVDAPDGSSWFVHFQEKQPYGRIVHLQPVRWIDDWPVMGADSDGNGAGDPVARHALPVVTGEAPRALEVGDDFDAPQLALAWQWHANPRPEWSSLDERPGWLRLTAVERAEGHKSLWDAPALLLQKFPAPSFSATCRLDASGLTEGETAGLVVMGRDYAYLGVQRTADGLRLVRRTCRSADGGRSEKAAGEAPLAADTVELRVAVAEGGLCRFEHRTEGDAWLAIGEPFQAREGRWIGAKVGLFCLAGESSEAAGHADIDRFHID